MAHMQWNALLVQSSRRLRELRCVLEESDYYDKSRRITKLSDFSSTIDSSVHKQTEHFAIPITQSCVDQLKVTVDSLPHPFTDCKLVCVDLPCSKKEQAKHTKPCEVLKEAVRLFLNRAVDKSNILSSEEIEELLLDIPTSWERHNDLVVLSVKSFKDPRWKLVMKQNVMPQTSTGKCNPFDTQYNDPSPNEPFYHNVKCLTPSSNCESPGEKKCNDRESDPDTNLNPESPSLWQVVASAMKCKRLAIDQNVACNHYRSSRSLLLLGDNGWVEHVDNGVCYIFDVTKCMFSSGNISEKLRVAKFDCRGETVVDLYAGIGYFTLPYLVHTGALKVHACEWNPDAVEALQRGLVANMVEDRCVIHCGDNRKVAPKGVADRVNLGLVPSSEGGWPVACAALKNTTGGWLHVHGNVSSKTSDGFGTSRYETQSSFRCAEHNPWDTQSVDARKQCAAPLKDTNCLSIGASNHKPRQETKAEHHTHIETSHEVETNKPSHMSNKRGVWQEWGDYVARKILELLTAENPLDSLHGKSWHVTVGHIEQVKSYAPHIDHVVVDLECRPVTVE